MGNSCSLALCILTICILSYFPFWFSGLDLGSHCDQLKLTFPDDSACDQVNFVKNYIGHPRLICHFKTE